MTIQTEEAYMSDSSNPSVSQQNEGNPTEPYDGGSSANSLGAPSPDPDAETGAESGSESDRPDGAMPDPDIKGDPDQVTW